MIRFGPLSIVLFLGVAQGCIVTLLLLARRENRVANRLLAALTFAFSLRIVPYVIGYAGVYDRYPWLSFAPFAITLLYGPLIYLYVARLTAQALPRRWFVHVVPAAVQVIYLLAIFVQPLAFKNDWDARVHEPWVVPAETILTFVSLGAYLALAARRYRGYRHWLDDATSDSLRHQLLWLRNFLVLFALTVALSLAFESYSRFVRHLSYFNYFPLFLWYAALVYYLGMEGWRNAARAFPQPTLSDPTTPGPSAARVAPSADWPALAAAWQARVQAAEYWRDPDLTLASLASELAMTPAHLSRVINVGLGQNFNEAINRMRIAHACARLADPAELRDILAIAFDAGFNSKASFNRRFKEYTGTTPTDFRRTPQAERLIS